MVLVEMETTNTMRIARLIRPPRPRCASGLSWTVASENGVCGGGGTGDHRVLKLARLVYNQ